MKKMISIIVIASLVTALITGCETKEQAGTAIGAGTGALIGSRFGHGDGRLRSPYLEALYGPEIYTLLQKTKKIFDPYNTLNPGVKIDVTLDDIKPLLRSDYSVDHLYDHLPR